MRYKFWGQVAGIVFAGVLLSGTTVPAQVVSQMPLVAKPEMERVPDDKSIQENRGSGFVASAFPMITKADLHKTDEAKAKK